MQELHAKETIKNVITQKTTERREGCVLLLCVRIKLLMVYTYEIIIVKHINESILFCA